VPSRVLEEYPVRFACRCTPERVRKAIVAMGRDEVAALLDEGKPAEAVCEFCNTTYTVAEADLRELLHAMDAPDNA
jgi:molecular chaperone Hsp33